MLKQYRDNLPPPEVIEVSLQSKSRIKRSRRVQYPELDSVLHEWFLRFEQQVPMSGDLIKERAAHIFKALYPREEKIL